MGYQLPELVWRALAGSVHPEADARSTAGWDGDKPTGTRGVSPDGPSLQMRKVGVYLNWKQLRAGPLLAKSMVATRRRLRSAWLLVTSSTTSRPTGSCKEAPGKRDPRQLGDLSN
jgi:hypothetical protein